MRFFVLCSLAFLAGCATASHDDRAALLSAPIECPTAKADISALEAARPSGGERARSILQSATPIGAVAGAASGDYGNRAAVATGKTQSELETRIAEIKQRCILADAPNRTEFEG